MMKSFCNRCGDEAKTTAKLFESEEPVLLEVIARSKEDISVHICDGCLAELLMSAVETFPNTKTAVTYHSSLKDAQERDALLEEVEALKADKAKLISESIKADEKASVLEKKLHIANEQLDVQIKLAQKAKVDAEAHIRKTTAELRQRAEDEKNDPEYIERVSRRERMRSAG
jgi:hypothetical protein